MKTILTIVLLLIAVVLPLFLNTSEGFSNYALGGASPAAEILVQDTFPITGINGVSNKQASDMWWQYPIFKVGSYDQITNNIRYSRNPDIGRCTPADFCDALYKDVKNKSNYITPLPPVDDSDGTRVGYFVSPLL